MDSLRATPKHRRASPTATPSMGSTTGTQHGQPPHHKEGAEWQPGSQQQQQQQGGQWGQGEGGTGKLERGEAVSQGLTATT